MITFAPANRERSDTKQEEHVPRHIELTAVSFFEARQKKQRIS